jgi:hypothetical protein
MPLSTARFSLHGRPRLSARRTGSGKKRPMRSREVTGMSRSSEGHPFRMAAVPIGRIAFRSRNGVCYRGQSAGPHFLQTSNPLLFDEMTKRPQGKATVSPGAVHPH